MRAAATPQKRRKILPKAQRRQQLIEATIACIARYGLASTTMHMVTREAGLSVGIANLHFKTKENLLRETLRYVAEEYHKGQIEIMRGSEADNLSDRLTALLNFQLGRGVTQRQKMVIGLPIMVRSVHGRFIRKLYLPGIGPLRGSSSSYSLRLFERGLHRYRSGRISYRLRRTD